MAALLGASPPWRNGLARVKRMAKRGLYVLLPRRLRHALVLSKMPSSAQLEVTTSCNLRCPLCITHITPRGVSFLEATHVERVVAACRHRMKQVSFHLMGEPLLHKELFQFVRRCEDAGISSSFSTNGMILDRHVDEILDSGLTHISIAIDGVDAGDYSKYRVGGDFGRVVANVKALMQERERRGLAHPVVQAQMIMFSYNEDREREAEVFLRELGTDVVSLKRPAYVADPTPEAQEFWSKVDHENDERRYSRPVSEPQKLYRHRAMCPQLERATVLADGSVVACCLDARGETSFGNLTEQDFASVWRSRAHRKILEDFSNRSLSTCQHCTLGSLRGDG